MAISVLFLDMITPDSESSRETWKPKIRLLDHVWRKLRSPDTCCTMEYLVKYSIVHYALGRGVFSRWVDDSFTIDMIYGQSRPRPLDPAITSFKPLPNATAYLSPCALSSKLCRCQPITLSILSLMDHRQARRQRPPCNGTSLMTEASEALYFE